MMRRLVAGALTALVACASLHVVVDFTTSLSNPLPSDFASVSAEVPCASQFIAAANNSYVNLLQFLKNASGGKRGPNIRIGGNSADWTWYSNVPNATLPKGDTNQVNITDIQTFVRVGEWSGTMTIDINLMNESDPHNSVAYTLEALKIIPHHLIDGFEVGNEPDLFMYNGIRNSSYSYGNYESDFEFYVAALVKAGLPMPWIQGAVICCDWWEPNMTQYIDKFSTFPHNVLSSFSHHYYPMSGVSSTFEKLLATWASQGVQATAATAEYSIKRGVPYYIGEGNSAYTGGKEGVSNSFATALWAVDTMFYAATAHMTRFNFHGCPGRTYTPITNDGTDVQYARARPLYYGMLAFTEAIAYNSYVVNATISDGMNASNIRAWSTFTAEHPLGSRLCVVLLQKNLTTFDPVNVSVSAGLPFAGTHGRVTRVHPTNFFVNATWNISYGGISFDDSTNGMPIGVRTYENVSTDTSGEMLVRVDPASITLIELFSSF